MNWTGAELGGGHACQAGRDSGPPPLVLQTNTQLGKGSELYFIAAEQNAASPHPEAEAVLQPDACSRHRADTGRRRTPPRSVPGWSCASFCSAPPSSRISASRPQRTGLQVVVVQMGGGTLIRQQGVGWGWGAVWRCTWPPPKGVRSHRARQEAVPGTAEEAASGTLPWQEMDRGSAGRSLKGCVCQVATE